MILSVVKALVVVELLSKSVFSPSLVKAKAPVTFCESTIFALPPIVVALARATVPAHVALATPVFAKAPAPPTPVPFRVSASEVPSVKPFKSRVAPDETVTPPAEVPKGVLVAVPAAPNFNVPELMVVAPL